MPSVKSPKMTPAEATLMEGSGSFKDASQYEAVRDLLLRQERSRAFDAEALENATNLELKAADIVGQVRDDDQTKIYAPARHRNGRQRYAGGPYLENLDLINASRLLSIAQHVPKGAHLHIHYNSGLPPRMLVEHARNIKAMWIRTSLPLTNEHNFRFAEVQFLVQQPPSKQGNIFAPNYVAMDWMQYQDFLRAYPGGVSACEQWLVDRLTFTEEQTHGQRQTVTGIWDEFAINTRMIKGLFGYESAFRDYTRELIRSFVKDGIQYAELRPNFPSNVLPRDDASANINNAALCQIIIDEVRAAKANLKPGQFFYGVKVIYCAPKLRPAANMATNLNECIALKQQFPNLICGFDMVGPEETMAPIHEYIPQLLEFRQRCNDLHLDIPFLLHAGETLQNGGQTDANLLDALLLGCKRIGHGFALAQHPTLMELFKKKNIALEVCPIGNEILHLCPTIGGHALNTFLANDVHCTINCDNSIFYSSTLSHDFYQVMIGSTYQNLLGWKVLAKWSLEHSCLNENERAIVDGEWDAQWSAFLRWIIRNHPNEAAVWDRAHPGMRY
ncbi:MAG: hypothetical protein M1818_006949 [Claussenomyces sp. TS43310]|nr:MAG: hypothetical protein M1818_006949 [Claussenomyces sp. TS43310]